MGTKPCEMSVLLSKQLTGYLMKLKLKLMASSVPLRIHPSQETWHKVFVFGAPSKSKHHLREMLRK